MGRPRVEVNPKTGERLRIVAEEQQLRLKDLANLIFISPQNFSRIINGRASLTEANARLISAKYPQYSAEWLLGLVDYKNEALRPLYEAAMQADIRNDPEKRLERHYRAVNDLAELAGYPMLSMGERFVLFGQGEYADITFDDYERLCDDILDYVEFKAGQLLRKTLEKQNPAPGADTPGAGAGQKADGPLPSDHTTEQEV